MHDRTSEQTMNTTGTVVFLMPVLYHGSKVRDPKDAKVGAPLPLLADSCRWFLPLITGADC